MDRRVCAVRAFVSQLFLPCSAAWVKALPRTRQNGATALIIASENGHIDVVRLLAASGADISAVQRGDMVPALHTLTRARARTHTHTHTHTIAILWTG